MNDTRLGTKLMELKDDLNNRIITECRKYWNNLNMNNNIVFDIKSVDDVLSILSEKAKLIVNELLDGINIQSRTDTFISIYVLMRIVVESYLVPLNNYDISENNIYSVINLINFRLVDLRAYYNKDCDIRMFKKAIETAYLTILRLFITAINAILHRREAVEAWDYFLLNNTSSKQIELVILNSNKVKLSAMKEVLSKLGLSDIVIKDNSSKFEKENKDIIIKPSPIKFDNNIALVDSCLSDIRKVVASECTRDTDKSILESFEADKLGNLISLSSLIDDMIDNSNNEIYLQQVESILSTSFLRVNDKINNLSKKTIYSIVGESGSGKDSLVRYTIDKYKLDPKFRPIVSFTDRPKRDNETDGVQHHFISSSEFDDITMNKEVIAYTKIGKYRYMTIKDNFNNGNIYVIDPKGLKDFKRDYGDKYDIVTIYIDTPYKVRKQRISERSDSNKFIDRSESEKRMFEDFRKYRDYDYIIDNGNLTSMDEASMFLVKILTK